MNNFPYIDILILAMIAVFIINRLKNTLGKKTGNENDIVEKFTQRKTPFKESEPDTISEKKIKNNVDLAKTQKLHSNKKINEMINEVIKLDVNFEINSFIDGAKKAFEYILTQYSKNDIKSLNSLISKEIFSAFNSQIKQREKNSETLEITVISVKDPEKAIPEIIQRLIKINIPLQSIKTETSSLEDAFLNLTGKSINE